MYQLIDYFIYLFFFNSHISKVYLPREMLEIIFSYLKDELIYKINKKVLVQMLDRKLHENTEIYNNIEKKIICATISYGGYTNKQKEIYYSEKLISKLQENKIKHNVFFLQLFLYWRS